jgi:hypothetical protein
MMHSRGLLTLAFVLCSRLALADAPPPPAERSAELFAERVAPLLELRCVRCHGAQQQESGLRLDRAEFIRRGGDRGDTLVVGEPSQSWLYRAVSPDDDELQMPPEGEPLSSDDVSAIRDWIASGGVWPDSVKTLHSRFSIRAEDRAYWAFVPPGDVAVPSEEHDAWSRNEIDRFVLRRLHDAGLEPLSEADCQTMIRRLYFDLIGLPPTPDEVDSFTRDTDPQAYARLVDELLKRPEFGQRWARLWLDLVRYAESDGFKADAYRPDAWLFRDYVVQSFNDDKPYDRFLQEQLAGDELFPDDPQARVATGYLRLWPLEDNQKDVQRQWALILDDITEVTSEAVLGLGIRCAKCHDHKYDPIPQADYYRLRAFFAALLPRDDLRVPRRLGMPELRRWEDETAPIRQAMRQMENRFVASRKQTIAAYPPYLQAMYDQPPEAWTPLDQQYAYLARPQIEKRSNDELEFKGQMRQEWDRLKDNLQQHTLEEPELLATAMTVTDVGPQAPPTRLANNSTDPEVAPGFLTVLDPHEATIEPISGNPRTTGRRATLARWLTQPDHPLTSRVIVNRIWQQHFGRGIVATANDFGRQGTPPTHPELLDWLARRFVADGWSLKKLHRLIVTSATYRQSTLLETDDVGLAQQTYRGHLPRRIDAEQIRDAMLAVSGELQPYRSEPSVSGERPVRSIMVKNIRNRPNEWLNAFDGPDMFNSCARRFVTTTPLQSLLVVNSPWSLQRAEGLARRIQTAGTPSADNWATQSFRYALSREPHLDELLDARPFLAPQGQPSSERLVDFCHVLLCSNEFIYLD